MNTQVDTRFGILAAPLLMLVAAITLMTVTATADQGVITRVSVDNLGNQGNNHSEFPSISAGGRYVAFDSEASNLVAGDTNGNEDAFVHDTETGETT